VKVAKPKPVQIILLSYLLLIAVGTLLLLYTPTTRHGINVIDAFFMVTSAVTVTGLVVVDPVADFTLLGQLLILLLIQTGGLGYMALTTFFLVILGRRIGIRERLILAESLNYPGIYGLVRFLKRVILFAFGIEALGFLLLLPPFLREFPTAEAVFFALFHAVSAFNNAGFCLLSGGLEGRIGILSFAMALIGREREPVLRRPEARLLTTLFLSVSSRTAGFSTVDLESLSESSLFLLMMLMFVGASPGGTGGGIKTTVIFLAVCSYIKGKGEVRVFERSVGTEQIYRAMVILSLSILFISFTNLLIDRLEEKDFLSTFFEVLSAFSTVGLSVGDGRGLSFSSQFGTAGKLLIALSMIVGRIGILSFAMALIGREREPVLRRPEARLLRSGQVRLSYRQNPCRGGCGGNCPGQGRGQGQED